MITQTQINISKVEGNYELNEKAKEISNQEKQIS
jgi:hypothetical protein